MHVCYTFKLSTQCLKLTAKSTRCSFPMRTWCWPSGPFSLHSTVMVKIAWEREDLSFMFVAPTEPAIKQKFTNKNHCSYSKLNVKVESSYVSHWQVITSICQSWAKAYGKMIVLRAQSPRERASKKCCLVIWDTCTFLPGQWYYMLTCLMNKGPGKLPASNVTK